MPAAPTDNPEEHGQGGILGGCPTCFDLLDLLAARIKLDAAAREFARRAAHRAKVDDPSQQLTGVSKPLGTMTTSSTASRNG